MAKKTNIRDITNIINTIHIAIGIVIVVLTVILFIAPQEHLIYFPVVFALASIINYIKGIYVLSFQSRDRKRRKRGIIFIIIGAVLTIIGIASALTALG